VVDNLLTDLKGKYVFNHLNDLVTYSPTVTGHQEHLREGLHRLQKAGFTLNNEKLMLGASEIKYLGHYLSARGIRVIPDRVEVIKQFPRSCNIRGFKRFVGMVGFYARFVPDFFNKAAPLHKLK
jgi:hypothetical protein